MNCLQSTNATVFSARSASTGSESEERRESGTQVDFPRTGLTPQMDEYLNDAYVETSRDELADR